MWNKGEKHINIDCAVTGWVLCVIPNIREDVFKNTQNKHHIQVNNVIKTFFLDQLKNSYMEFLIRSGENVQISTKRMIPLTVMILSGTVKILLMVTVICGIINTHYHPIQFLVL